MKTKVAYICAVSNQQIKTKLHYMDFTWANKVRSWFGIPPLEIVDSAPWNTEFISEFEKDSDREYYVISPQIGLKSAVEKFENNGIHYVFYKSQTSIANRLLKRVLNWDERTDYRHYRSIIKKQLSDINPDIVVLCGAENPIYSLSALDVKDKPILVILQTLLNSAKRIEMGVGSAYRRDVESRILRHAKYFSVIEQVAKDYLGKNNPNAKCFKFNFPTKQPHVDVTIPKEFDFIFFARGITKFKGVEDTIKAFSVVHKEHPEATLNISGGCDPAYKQQLEQMVEEYGIKDAVSWHGHFDLHADVFRQLQKAHAVVVPGITSALNSTVKEAMLMGLPTIVYETSATPEINRQNRCLFTAKMEDTVDLAKMMISVLEDKEAASKVAVSGRRYAERNFSTQASSSLLIASLNAIINHTRNETSIPEAIIFKDEK